MTERSARLNWALQCNQVEQYWRIVPALMKEGEGPRDS